MPVSVCVHVCFSDCHYAFAFVLFVSLLTLGVNSLL